jgi:hypothetical protein
MQAFGRETVFYNLIGIFFPKNFQVTCELLYEVKWEEGERP